MDLVRTSLAYNERRIELTIEQHQGIVAAIERQDSKAAEEVTRAHIQDARKARLALLLEFHDEIEVAKRNELQRESLDPNAMR